MTTLPGMTTLKRMPFSRSFQALSIRQKEGLTGLIFVLPWMAGFLLLKLGPIIAALWFSFTDFYLLEPENMRFVGLENYITVFKESGTVVGVLGSINYFLLTVPLELFLALGLAAIFSNNKLRGKSFLRILFFMTSIIPAGVVASVWFGLVNPSTGWLTTLILNPLGLSLPNGDPTAFIVMMAVWGIGPGFLIMQGAMQGVPQEVYEAAQIDGAGPLTRFFRMTVPMISPAIFFSLVINLAGAFGGSALLDRGYIFRESPSPMENLISNAAFSSYKLGYASALAWVMFAVILTITLVLFNQSRRWVHYPEEQHDDEI